MRTKIKRIYNKVKRSYARYVYNKNKPYLDQHDRIYHFHIRKSAGTSINSAFWNLSGLNLKVVKRTPLLIKGKYVYVRNNEHLIEEGNFFYGNSHIPFWNIKIPEKTFTFCMLRDPYKRLLSLYRYLKWVHSLDPKTALNQEPYYKTVYKQTAWLGDNFNDFLESLPDKHLRNQLLMFSKTGSVDEAVKNINTLNAIYNQENFEKAIDDLSKVIGLKLNINRERVFGGHKDLDISKEMEEKAKALLSDEYEFYNRVEQKYALP